MSVGLALVLGLSVGLVAHLALFVYIHLILGVK